MLSYHLHVNYDTSTVRMRILRTMKYIVTIDRSILNTDFNGNLRYFSIIENSLRLRVHFSTFT